MTSLATSDWDVYASALAALESQEYADQQLAELLPPTTVNAVAAALRKRTLAQRQLTELLWSTTADLVATAPAVRLPAQRRLGETVPPPGRARAAVGGAATGGSRLSSVVSSMALAKRLMTMLKAPALKHLADHMAAVFEAPAFADWLHGALDRTPSAGFAEGLERQRGEVIAVLRALDQAAPQSETPQETVDRLAGLLPEFDDLGAEPLTEFARNLFPEEWFRAVVTESAPHAGFLHTPAACKLFVMLVKVTVFLTLVALPVPEHGPMAHVFEALGFSGLLPEGFVGEQAKQFWEEHYPPAEKPGSE